MPRAIVWALFFFACNPETPPNAPPAPLEALDATPKKVSKGSPLFVDDKLADCEGDHPMKCMRTRTSKDGEWELFYTPIEGFTFEEGSTYELRVDMSVAKRPRLVEIVTKTKTTP